MLTFLVSTLCHANSIIVWHTLDLEQVKFFNSLVAEFNQTNHSNIQTETGMELPHAIIEQLEDGTPPQAVLAPSDLAGLTNTLQLSPVPKTKTINNLPNEVLVTVKSSGKVWGAPILDGNHLMLFYNKSLIPNPPDSIEGFLDLASSPKGTTSTIAWNFQEPYVFGAFLGVFEPNAPLFNGSFFNSSEFKSALNAYKILGAQKSPSVVANGSYASVTDDFYNGTVAAAINGDWAIFEAKKRLGDNLGLAPLPKYQGRHLQSPSATQALIFPGRSLDSKDGPILLKFAEFLQSRPIQERWLTEARRLPVNPETIKKAHHGEDLLRQSAALLTKANRISASESTMLMWPALRKGLRLYMHGAKSEAETAQYIQKMISPQNINPADLSERPQ